LHLEGRFHRGDPALQERVLAKAALVPAVERLRQIQLRALGVGGQRIAVRDEPRGQILQQDRANPALEKLVRNRLGGRGGTCQDEEGSNNKTEGARTDASSAIIVCARTTDQGFTAVEDIPCAGTSIAEARLHAR
jgi:hypothetical protein